VSDEIDTTDQDREANYFAMCLLMPENFLRADVAEYRGAKIGFEDMVRTLAQKYQVEPERMTLRLAQLGLIA